MRQRSLMVLVAAAVAAAFAGCSGGGGGGGGQQIEFTAASFSVAETGAAVIITIPLLDDDVVEGRETITLSLGAPTGGVAIGSLNTAVLTITDDDSAGVLQFSAPTYTYAEDGTATPAITVQRVGGIDGAVSAVVIIADGTANQTAPESSKAVAPRAPRRS